MAGLPNDETRKFKSARTFPFKYVSAVTLVASMLARDLKQDPRVKRVISYNFLYACPFGYWL